MARPTRVLIADDSAHTREGLHALLATWPEILVVGEAADGEAAVRMAAEQLPNVVLMDLHMPVLDGVEATRRIKQRWPAMTVVVLTMNPAEQQLALAAGADAFVVKGGAPEQLMAALGIDLLSQL